MTLVMHCHRNPRQRGLLICIASPELQGGYGVPDAVIHRRFASGLDNFHRHYKLAVNDWALYDNTGATPVLLDWGENA